MHWITIRLSRQENSCLVFRHDVTNDAACDCLSRVTRLWPGARSDTDWDSAVCGPVARGAGHRSAGSGPGDRGRHRGLSWTPRTAHTSCPSSPSTSYTTWIRLALLSLAYTTHFSFPFQMTNDTLSPVGQNRMQQCRVNISRVISGHSKQTLTWASHICQRVVLVDWQWDSPSRVQSHLSIENQIII